MSLVLSWLEVILMFLLMSIVFPEYLKSNSTIGLVCPAGGFQDYKPIDRIVKYLKKLGYGVKVGKSVCSRQSFYKYLSGSDYERISDFHNFLKDDCVNAIFCLRGGYGSLRLLDNIDFKLVRKARKVIIGFSDITVLLLSIFAKSNLVTFHGPMLSYKFFNSNYKYYDKNTVNNFWEILTTSEKFTFSYSSKVAIIKSGKVKGRLLGGNLTDICSMLGSKYLPDFTDSIFFLEDISEEPYKIDRMLTQLVNAGIFNEVRGVLFGTFHDCGFKNKKEIIKLIKDRIGFLDKPIVYGFPIGHDIKNYVVPIGIQVLFDAKKGTLIYL